VADEPKPQTPADAAKPAEGANISPAPAEISMAAAKEGTGAEAKAPGKDGAPAPASNMQPDPLSDGTVPTVLTPGAVHKSVPKGRASISSIYRRADILTTVFTFIGALVAAGLIFGGYAYFTRSKAPAVKAPKVTELDKADLAKLGSFFDGNTAGNTDQVLTISASTLFKNRVAVANDVKVTGGLQVTATTALSDLTVDKVTTLGVTNIRGQLVVAGPVSFQSPAQLGAGGSVNGNLAVTGNGSFGGSLSAGTLNIRDLSVTGTLNLAGHLSIAGSNPSASALSGAGPGASAQVDGNDSGGTVTINTGTIPNFTTPFPGAQLVTVNFRSAYPRVPRVVITPIGQSTGALEYFIIKTATGFTIGTANKPNSSTGYSFDYWVVQ
jgi:hypothetical protein